MKATVNYLSDTNGKTVAVQVSVSEWKKILSTIRKYEQTLRFKSDLTEALNDVKKIRRGKSKKQTLSAFLNEI